MINLRWLGRFGGGENGVNSVLMYEFLKKNKLKKTNKSIASIIFFYCTVWPHHTVTKIYITF